MGIELIVLYSIYAISGAVVGTTLVNTTENIWVAKIKANSDKYVACQANSKNDALSCKSLE